MTSAGAQAWRPPAPPERFPPDAPERDENDPRLAVQQLRLCCLIPDSWGKRIPVGYI